MVPILEGNFTWLSCYGISSWLKETRAFSSPLNHLGSNGYQFMKRVLKTWRTQRSSQIGQWLYRIVTFLLMNPAPHVHRAKKKKDWKFYCLEGVASKCRNFRTLRIVFILPSCHKILGMIFKKSTSLPRFLSLSLPFVFFYLFPHQKIITYWPKQNMGNLESEENREEKMQHLKTEEETEIDAVSFKKMWTLVDGKKWCFTTRSRFYSRRIPLKQAFWV